MAPIYIKTGLKSYSYIWDNIYILCVFVYIYINCLYIVQKCIVSWFLIFCKFCILVFQIYLYLGPIFELPHNTI